jgi:Spy/CpxP family protein refolding chaperone
VSEAPVGGEPVTGARPLTRGRALALAGLVLALVFAAGLALGVVAERTMLHHGPRGGGGGGMFGERRDGRGPGGPGGRAAMREHLAKELGLDSAQSARIDAIMERHRPAIDSARGAMESRLAGVIQETRREIDSVLTPAQREKMHERWQREDARRAVPGRPPAGGAPR